VKTDSSERRLMNMQKFEQKFDLNRLRVALLELQRERKVREFYYPKAVAEGKLTKREAERRLEALDYAIEVLKEVIGLGADQDFTGR